MLRTRNLITSANKFEQERATLEAIKNNLEAKNYSEVYTLTCNYLGHIPHYKSHEDICYTILELVMYDIDHSTDSAPEFLNHLLSDLKYMEDRE